MAGEHGETAADIGFPVVFRYYPEVAAVFKGAVPSWIVILWNNLGTALEVSDFTVGHDRVLRDHSFVVVHAVGEFVTDYREDPAGIHHDLRSVLDDRSLRIFAFHTCNKISLDNGVDHFGLRQKGTPGIKCIFQESLSQQAPVREVPVEVCLEGTLPVRGEHFQFQHPYIQFISLRHGYAQSLERIGRYCIERKLVSDVVLFPFVDQQNLESLLRCDLSRGTSATACTCDDKIIHICFCHGILLIF